MKKTFSININGLLFNIDEDAFEKLNNYLKTLKKHFKNTEGGDDIVMDIEARIAEILKTRIKDIQQIVTLKDVEFIIETLGQPFEMDEESERSSPKRHKRIYSNKRIFRDPDNQIFGGVASGLAAYFNIDLVIIRLIFVLTILIGGVGIIVYLTLWILTPYASTTAEKIEMEGETVDIKTIEKKVREELESLKNRFQDFSNEAGDVMKKKKKDSISGLNQFGHFLINILRIFFRILAILFGIIFLIVGIALSMVFAATYLGLTPAIQFEEFSVEAISFPAFLNSYIITTPYELILNIALFLVLFIPVVGLIFSGIRLIFNLGRQKIFGISAVILWVLAIMVAFTLSVKTIEEFKTESKQIVVNTMDSIRSDTLNLSVYNLKYYKELEQKSLGSIYFEDDKLMFCSDDIFYGNSGLTFSKADNEDFELVIRTSVRGENIEAAKERLKSTKYHFKIDGNNLEIDPYFTLRLNEKWRDQEVTFEIKVPEGKTLFIDREARNYFQWHYWHHSRRSMSGKYWIMTDDGLEEAVTN
ncbi:MAG: PspC domain-containing protein [Bacteroidales bacterium]|nr:PspC domain-containing protein [Bacteroidales bacterium]